MSDNIYFSPSLLTGEIGCQTEVSMASLEQSVQAQPQPQVTYGYLDIEIYYLQLYYIDPM